MGKQISKGNIYLVIAIGDCIKVLHVLLESKQFIVAEPQGGKYK